MMFPPQRGTDDIGQTTDISLGDPTILTEGNGEVKPQEGTSLSTRDK
jgi:hypothetical protein